MAVIRSPMLLSNLNILHIHTIHKPSALSIPVRAEKDVVPTHHPLAHLPRLPIKGPVLEAIAPLPAHSIFRILKLVPELHGNAIIGEGEDLLAEPVALFPIPLLSQEVDDGFRSGEKRGAIAPDAVCRVGLRDSGGISVSPDQCLFTGCFSD